MHTSGLEPPTPGSLPGSGNGYSAPLGSLRNLWEARAKGNLAEFVGALLSVPVKQDFTGCSNRDTLVQHWPVCCQKGAVSSHHMPLPICSSPYTSSTVQAALQQTGSGNWFSWKKKKKRFHPPFSHPCLKYFLQVIKKKKGIWAERKPQTWRMQPTLCSSNPNKHSQPETSRSNPTRAHNEHLVTYKQHPNLRRAGPKGSSPEQGSLLLLTRLCQHRTKTCSLAQKICLTWRN